MKINEVVAGKAAALLGLGFYVLCFAVATVLPDLYKAVAGSWFHMVDLSSVWKEAPEGFVLGLVSFTVVSWLSGYLFAVAYNKLLKSK